MQKPLSRLKCCWIPCVLGILLGTPSMGLSKPFEGVGELKFGMTPEAVQSLAGCSSPEDCLYELLGKNRYFTLSYDSPPSPSNSLPPSMESRQPRTLQSIDVDMGNYTREWFLELFEVLQSQYPLAHSPTEQEDVLFQQQKQSELVIGFSDGHVLLKVVRRTFGNLVLHVVFQDIISATQTRQMWALPSASPVPSAP